MGSLAEGTERPFRRWSVFLPLWLACLGYAWTNLDEIWIPHDEGTLAQAAERVLFGELPHRDFDEVYTGGLDWFHAAAFEVLGHSLRSMRLALFGLFALWVPACWWIATRFVGPIEAVPFVALGAAWSIPIYPSPMPSWHVLFLATFGTAALLRHLASGRARWLVAAGVCGGLAVLVKITGLHFIAAGLLALAWREPSLTAGAAPPGGRASRAYPVVLTMLLVAFVAALAVQIAPMARRFGVVIEAEEFVLPGALVAALVARRAWVGSRARSAVRFKTLLRLALPFLAGIAVPVAAFVAWYLRLGGLPALVQGVLILPGRRLDSAAIAPPPLWTMAFLVPLLAVAALPAARGRRWPRVMLVVAGAALLAVLPLVHASSDWFWGVQLSARHLPPVLGGWALVRCLRTSGREPPDAAATVLCASMLVGLVQFPFPASVYFFYSAPLLVLAVLGLTARDRSLAQRPGVALAAAFFLAAALFVPARIGVPWRSVPTKLPANDRVGMPIPVTGADEYDRVAALVRAHARGGFVWAGPDAPEVAFLAGLRNPTRTIFDFFDADFAAPPAERAARILHAIDAHGVTAVVLNLGPAFSGPASVELVDGLRARFPSYEATGGFAVAWKD